MIYIVEDDSSIRDIILYTLESCGWKAAGFSSGTEFFDALTRQQPELVLLDVMLPGMSGMSILEHLKEMPEYAAIPVIMATARGLESDKIAALDAGADDYLVKPFGMMEMVARIRALLRRSKRDANPSLLKMGGIEMNTTFRQVQIDGEPVELTRKEFELLRLFLMYPGRAFGRDELLYRIWDVEFAGQTRTVDVHIRALRSKLKDYKDYIQTLRGVGYRMEEKK